MWSATYFSCNSKLQDCGRLYAVKYIVYQNGYEKSEKKAQKNNVNLYNTGGSVTTLAMDVALQLGCKRLICVGLDLALTNGLDHASDTPQAKSVNYDGGFYRNVPAVGGGNVVTTKGLDGFRKWIETRIASVKDVEIIDATEGGALIKGMINKKLSDFIEPL